MSKKTYEKQCKEALVSHLSELAEEHQVGDEMLISMDAWLGLSQKSFKTWYKVWRKTGKWPNDNDKSVE